MIHGEVVTPVPTAYSETFPNNYTDVNMTGTNDLILNFQTNVVKSWTFYIMVKNQF